MEKFTDSIKYNLLVSLGTHKKGRTLSPIEVAQYFKMARDAGISNKKLAELVLFKDTSMIGKFLNLLKLRSDIQHLIDWGQTKSTISFSSATLIASLNVEDQKELANSVLNLRLTKNQIIQIIQINKRSGKKISQCVNEVIKSKPETQHVFFGVIEDNKIILFLERSTQLERDKLLINIIQKTIDKTIEWSGRLGIKNFTLVGGNEFASEIKKLKPNFEEYINFHLLSEAALNA